MSCRIQTMSLSAWALVALAAIPACQCRYDPPGRIAISGSLDFGAVPEGTLASTTLWIDGSGAAPIVEGGGDALSVRHLAGDVDLTGLLVVACDPGEAGQASGTLLLDFGEGEPAELDWSCQAGERPGSLPDPLLEPIDTQAFASVPASQLGEAAIAAEDGARFVLNPPSGDLFLSDPVAGRLWRQNAGYLVPGWGAWQPLDMEVYANWDPWPACLNGGMWNRQEGGCTGQERNGDGSLPENWAFVHSGFVGENDELLGVREGVALEDRQLIALVGERDGEGFAAVVDASLDVRLNDEHSYSYLQRVRQVSTDNALPEGLIVSPSAEGAWLVEPNTGGVWQLLQLDQSTPRAQRTELELGRVARWASSSAGLLVVGEDGAWSLLGTEGPQLLGPGAAWGLLDRRVPDLLATDGSTAWAWFDDPGVLGWRSLDGEGAGLLVLPPQLEGVDLLAADRIAGGAAETASMAWIAGESSAGEALLLGASAEHGVVERQGRELPASPMALAVDPAPHDVYLAWPAGSEGCDGELAELCSDGEHPALVGSYYAPYGLVPPTSTGHRLHMYLNPILETPKDPNVNQDFSKGAAGCGVAPEGVEQGLSDGCCALEWAVEQRVIPNLDYVHDTWMQVGADTQASEDDVSVVVGLNPTWLRQARHCYVQPATRHAGYAALEILAHYRDLGFGFTHWTHTSMADETATQPMDFFMGLLYESGVDYSFPMDSQAEYQMLHDGMYAAVRYDDLPAYDDGGVPVDPVELELPLQAISGNHFDGPVMISDEGWPEDEPSWIRAGRDGPLALGDAPFQAYYFASAGTDPAVGLDGFRKKELFPLDIRRRMAAFEMGEEPEDWFEGGDSEVLYLPGHSHALNTLGDLAESGLFRESQVWGTDTEARDWEQVLRYLRRVLASSQPEDVKVWYLHIYDFTSPSGMIEDNAGVSADSDVNLDALRAIDALLVQPGYARWSDPDAVVQEWLDGRSQGGR
jgi:hypothetical protein